MSETKEEERQCPNCERCELFPRLKSDRTLQFCMEHYCKADYERCERFIHAAKHGKPPPATLLPNGEHLRVLDPRPLH